MTERRLRWTERAGLMPGLAGNIEILLTLPSI